MTILYFGMYSRGMEYPRNNNLIRGLCAQGENITEVHAEVTGSFRARIQVAKRVSSALRFLLRLMVSYAVLSWKFVHAPAAEVVVVGHPGYFHIHLARLLCRWFRPDSFLVYDAFIPLYDALVEDRRLLSPSGLPAKALHAFESSCCKAADLCLTDTFAHRRYLASEFKIDVERIRVLRVGPTVADAHTTPADPPADPVFRVLFVGTQIPLHGIEVILEAARQLRDEKDILFRIVGSGQESTRIHALARALRLNNVRFTDWVPTRELGDYIRSHDLGLGIFGTTQKASRVIPSKVFDLCAAGVPFVSADTPAMREVFTHRRNAYLVPAGDPDALAGAIRELKSNAGLRRQLGRAAMETGKTTLGIAEIGKNFSGALRRFSRDRRPARP